MAVHILLQTGQEKMKKRILIVDDEPSLAFLLAENLVDLGPDYEIETCCSGAEALALNQADPFDLVITDWMMPGINGLQLMRVLTQKQPETKLILMTAYGNEAIAIKAQDLGVTSYISKPFRMEEMLATVQAVLERKSVNSVNSGQRSNGSTI
jgi:DNA-binding response OmpR family regulator